jgi:hypothetical protein
MPDVLLQISSAGLDTGPFDITDNLGNTLATGVSREDLLAGITLFNVNSAVTQITATSTGVCKTSKSALVDFGGGGGGVTCSFVKFSIIPPETGSCRIYQLSAAEGTGSCTFNVRVCGDDSFNNLTVNEGNNLQGCYQQAPTIVAGTGTVVAGAICGTSAGTDYLVSYTLCDGTSTYATLNNFLTEVTVCIQDGSATFPSEIQMQTLGTCQ